MKRLSWLYILLILVGCTESSIENKPVINAGGEEFYASVEETDSRTYVDNQIRMRWHADDRITIFKKETYNREFKFTGKTGANSGGFKQVSVDDDFIYQSKVINIYRNLRVIHLFQCLDDIRIQRCQCFRILRRKYF